MGVFYLFAYIIGGGLITLASYRSVVDWINGEPLGRTPLVLGVGVLLIGCGAILHSIRVRRAPEFEGERTPPSKGQWYFALGAWLLPIVVSWAQFELYIDPLWMFPISTLCGAAWAVFLLAWRYTLNDRFGSVKRAVATSMVGLPLGILSIGLPLSHFRYHLTTINLSYSDEFDEPHVISMAPLEPTQPIAPSGITGDETMALIKAFADAKPIDVEEEIAHGRMRRLDDGTLVTVEPDGSTTPIETGFDVDAAFDEAKRRDQRAADEAREALFEAHRQKIQWLKESGRLFSRPSVPPPEQETP